MICKHYKIDVFVVVVLTSTSTDQCIRKQGYHRLFRWWCFWITVCPKLLLAENYLVILVQTLRRNIPRSYQDTYDGKFFLNFLNISKNFFCIVYRNIFNLLYYIIFLFLILLNYKSLTENGMETRDMDNKVYKSVNNNISLLLISIELSLSSNYNRFTIAIKLIKHAILINIANNSFLNYNVINNRIFLCQIR